MDIWLLSKMALIVLGITIPGTLAILEYLRHHKTFKFWLLVIASVLFLLFGVITGLKEYYGPEEDKKEILDAGEKNTEDIKKTIEWESSGVIDTVQAATDKINAHTDSVVEQIKKANQNTTQDFRPVIDLCIGNVSHPNPELKLTANGENLDCTFVICNVGDDPAYSILDKYVVVNYLAGKPTFYHNSAAPPLSNESSLLAPNGNAVLFTRSLSVSRNGPKVFPLTHPIYIYFKVTYTNRNEKKMPPLRKIYRLTEGGLAEVNQTDYKRIEVDLKSENQW